MAAGEDQPQAVVVHWTLRLGRLIAGMQQRRLRLAVVARGLPSQAVDRAVARRGDDPARRAGRQPALGPASDGLGEGVLHRVLGDVEVAEDAGENRDRATILGAERTLD